MITRYGIDVALPLVFIGLALILVSFFVPGWIARAALIIVGGFLTIFTLNFFRDPDRQTPSDPTAVVSPADGTVVSIGPVTESEYLQGPAMQVCIFMSPLNVHVNRWPVSGTVGFFRHVPGKFLVAFEDKSSEVNERTLIGVDAGPYKLLFKQIAGFVARRIVCPIAVGDRAVAGERFGMIKFGSRVDVLMPVDAAVCVSLNQKVTAGETILATLPSHYFSQTSPARREDSH